MCIIMYSREIFKFVLLTILLSNAFTATKSCKTPSLEVGYCVTPKECQFVIDLHDKYGDRVPDYLVDYMRRSKCSDANEPVRICCAAKKVIERKPVATEPPSRIHKYVEDLDYKRDYLSQLNSYGLQMLSNLRCGESNGNRISGGNVTELNEFPWMALLRYDSPGETFKCGGTLITNKFILTAAHCVNSPTDTVVSVRLGEHDLDRKVDCQGGLDNVCAPPVEDFDINEIIMHPKYNARRRINDIALIELKREVTFTKYIKPICLPVSPEATIPRDEKFLIAGWGTTEQGSQSRVLLKAFITVSDLAYCQNLFRIQLNEKHICAGDLETGRDTCKGDSGGPFFQLAPYYNSKKKYIQYGVVSFGGVACSLEQKLPTLYTNIITFMPWITNNIL